jgi:hypothetical protein
MESNNNQTFVALGGSKTYIGSYDAVSAYSSAKISLISDQSCEIIAYQSQNKKNTSSTVYTSSANVQFEQYLTLANPFLYFTVRNKSSTTQTILNFTVLYSVGQVSLINGGVNTNVNINASNGNPLTDTMGALNVNISNT